MPMALSLSFSRLKELSADYQSSPKTSFRGQPQAPHHSLGAKNPQCLEWIHHCL